MIDWQTTDNTELHYSFGMRGIVRELQQAMWPILDNLDQRPDWYLHFLHSDLTDAVLIPDLVDQLYNSLDDQRMTSPAMDQPCVVTPMYQQTAGTSASGMVCRSSTFGVDGAAAAINDHVERGANSSRMALTKVPMSLP